jgi:hypothetical protein
LVGRSFSARPWRSTGGTRRKIATGVHKDRYGIIARVKVGAGGEAVERAKRYPFDTKIQEIKNWQQAMRAELFGKRRRRPAGVAPGTFAADAKRYWHR